MPDPVLVERHGDIAVVVLNRPDKLNALNKAMWLGVRDAIRALSTDTGLRCVVLRGAGEKAFGPGADIAEFASERANARQAADYGRLMHETMAAIADCVHPTVAMIHGLCVGGGLELAIMCDLRICGESSRFGVPINRIGVTMAYPEIGALIELVGRSAALAILLEGRVFDAAEAHGLGLVTRVVPDAQVTEEALAAARRIADGAPLVNRWHKKFARRLRDSAPLTDAERAEPYETFDTDDYRDGFRAFLAKQKVVFKGR
ncbi:MAG TPA: enoyl-CoA hydratase-related protein [Candidatus Sulfotelmatobacter sp.]|nr:enoyl-CoA hydratase-related protein [Candidatus Sulfotelmatobacter sp.]